jgi:amidohydrolase
MTTTMPHSTPRTERPGREPAAELPGAGASPDADLRRQLSASIDSAAERWIRLRRRLHALPEASGEEKETTALVAELLREHGLQPRIGAGGVGIVADLDLGAPARTFVAVRSELDCVPVNDDKQVPYASTRPGLCHACGHDVHTTVNLAVATAIASHADALRRRAFRHNLRFVFQPAEETATGARSMIKQGAIGGVEAIVALHVDPLLDAGIIGVRDGPLTAACKSFRIVIRGRGGHSARPHEAIDPIPAAVSLVELLYQLCPRSVDCRYPLVLTVASIHSGSTFNAIPDGAEVCGTLRAARVEEMEAVQRRMDAVVDGVGKATGCDIELEFVHACPPTDNDPRLVRIMVGAANDVLGAESVRWLEVPSLGGEDFAFYQELIPGAFVRLGAAHRGDGRPRRPLHSSLFDVDESIIPAGAKVMSVAALRLAASWTAGSA